MRVRAPRIGLPGFGHDGAEVRIGQHVDPRRRRRFARRWRDHVLAPVRCEAAEAVEKNQVIDDRLQRRLRPVRARRRQTRHAHFDRSAAADLFGQRSARIGDDHARHRFEQQAVFVRNLLGLTHEYSAGTIDEMRFDAGRDQAENLLLQLLPIHIVVLVPDHQIDREPLEPPVRVRLHQLADQIDARCLRDLQQHDRQIARDRVTPQPRLAAPVAHQHARRAAQRCVRVQHRAREPAVKLRVGLGGIELPQHHLAVGPRQVEYAIGEAAVLILFDQAEHRVARIGHSAHDIDRRRVAGIDRDLLANRRDRIEHRSGRARQRAAAQQRARRGQRAAASDKAHAVGFERRRAGVAMHRHQLERYRRVLVARARPARAQNRGAPLDDLGLHEQVAERGVQRVGCRRRQHHFGIARDFYRAARAAAVGDAHAAQLDVVLGRNDDLGMRLDIEIAPAKLGAAFGEDRLVVLGGAQRGLVRDRPELAARNVAQVTEHSPVVACRVFAPARDREVFPAAAAAARVGHHHVVAAVGQQMHFGHRRVRSGQHAYRRLGAGCR